MRFPNERSTTNLTYSDVFMVPNRSDVVSWLDVGLTSTDGLATSLPLVAANMMVVSGRCMAETMVHRGGLAISPQDIPAEVVAQFIAKVKQSHPIFDTAVTISPHTAAGETVGLMAKRSHGVTVVVESGRVVGLVHPQDAATADRFAQACDVMTSDIVTVSPGIVLKQAFDSLVERHQKVALAAGPGELPVGIMTSKGVLRSALHTLALDEQGRLRTGVAIGVNGNVTAKVRAVLEVQADVLVVGTAHGYQEKMIAAPELACRECDRFAEHTGRRAPIVAGNAVTVDGVRDLTGAGADITEVGVGSGAMCTMRMQTSVGRPQLSVVLECSEQVRCSGCAVRVDGGVRHPRDVILTLAVGAGSAVIGSWFAGIHEFTGDQLFDHEGRAYKESFGMAPVRAVRQRTWEQLAFDRTRAALFEEGIPSPRMYLDPQRPSVEGLLDWAASGVRSSATYAGARALVEFNDRAVVGMQSGSGLEEGRLVSMSW